MSSILRADDPGVQFYDDVRAAFGSDDIAVVGVRADRHLRAGDADQDCACDRSTGGHQRRRARAQPDQHRRSGGRRLRPAAAPAVDPAERRRHRRAEGEARRHAAVREEPGGARRQRRRHQRRVPAADRRPVRRPRASTSGSPRSSPTASGPEQFFYTGASRITRRRRHPDAPATSLRFTPRRPRLRAGRALVRVPAHARGGVAADDGDRSRSSGRSAPWR